MGRSGKSLSLVIPRRLAAALNVRRGDLMVVGIQRGRLVARRVEEKDLLPFWHEEPAAVEPAPQ